MTSRRLEWILLSGCLAWPAPALGQSLQAEDETEARNEERIQHSTHGSDGDEPSSQRYFVARLALLGTYRSLYDLTLLGAGGELSLGCEGEMHGGHGMLRVMRGETAAGLTVTEIGSYGSYELLIRSFRLGIGGGLTWLRVQRITNSGTMEAIEPEAFARVGYEFGERSGVFVLAQLAAQLHAFGPTLYAGYRF